MQGASGQAGSRVRLWPSTMHHSVGLTDKGLVLGAGSVLVRMTKVSGTSALALDKDLGRFLAMLSVASGRLLEEAPVVGPICAASAHWQRGDKALANLRLAFAGLPKLREPADVYRLCLAEHLLDSGIAPAGLMRELWPDATDNDLRKYREDEPRVPAGSGRESGRWTSGPGGDATQAQRPDTIVVAEEDGPPESEREYEERRRLGESTIEEDARHGAIDPAGGLLPGGGPIANTATQLSAAAKGAVETVRAGRGPVDGTALHMEFKEQVKALGRNNLHQEQSYLNGGKR